VAVTYERFEDLPVWKAAVDLAVRIYELTGQPEFKGHYSLRDQLERATVSISNNIAEGFERGTTQELLTFIYIARGSAGEVRSMLFLIERLPAFANLKSQISNLKLPPESIAKQLRSWAEYLQNAEVKGQRHLSEKARREEQQRREREEAKQAREEDLRQFEEELRAKSWQPNRNQ
jgi:four helix bundle protein